MVATGVASVFAGELHLQQRLRREGVPGGVAILRLGTSNNDVGDTAKKKTQH